MARIQFKEGESILGIVIAVALAIAILVAAIAYAWMHHERKNNGTVGATPSSELRLPTNGITLIRA
jgi:hypothetical protein